MDRGLIIDISVLGAILAHFRVQLDLKDRIRNLQYRGLQLMQIIEEYAKCLPPENNGQSERSIQTLEDMLRMCAINFGGQWDDRLPLVEFAYNNCYHSRIGMAPYVGPFEIKDRVGIVTYRLELLLEFSQVYLVFHISILKKYISNPSHVLQPESIEINENLSYKEQLIATMDHQIYQLRSKQIPMVKVLWRN
ncbi:uncharacterized protein LOC110600571 [Manihot esculenta]|uniref:uncharacterized protein LOC110600571 n=1 Tax=Manihot esculenta TaxID=3983 RepID=UPI000B5D765C|nr:uncharacterized protein LOC110600571 [Manihot esculenta]